jgi:phosphopantetheinyl transferase
MTGSAAGEATVWLFPLPRCRDRGAGRALLRTVLSATVDDGTPPERWRFATEPFGRPRVVEPSPERVRFSVSYGHDAVAVAVSRRHDVGVDIEPLVPPRVAEIPWSELCPAERVLLRDTPPHERYERFVRMWTLKEAFAKCAGRGAFLSFSAIETTLDPPGVAGLTLHQGEVEVGGRRHALAVCMPATVRQPITVRRRVVRVPRSCTSGRR